MSSSSSESQSGSESESESESEYETVSEPIETESESAKKQEERERVVENENENEKNRESKRQRVGNEEEDEDENAMPKPSLFQKIWSDEDVIALLKGAAQYVEEKGVEPNSNMQDFYNFVSSAFHGKFRSSQVKDKLCRLKKKYSQNVQRNREAKSFASPHEKTLFELSKSVWLNTSTPPTFGSDGFIFTDHFLKSSSFSFGESFVRKYTANLGKNQQLEKKRLKLAIKEVELFRMKCEFVNEEAGEFLETLKSHYKK